MLNDYESPSPQSDQAAPYSVQVSHQPDGVLISVTGGSSQGGLDAGSVVAFLSAVDASQLEKDCLEGLGMLEGDGGPTFTQAILKRLIAYAQGTW